MDWISTGADNASFILTVGALMVRNRKKGNSRKAYANYEKVFERFGEFSGVPGFDWK